MTSKIKVDNIENQCGGAVVTKCGGTTTIAGTNVNATTVTATNVVGSTAVKSNAIQASDGGNLVSQSGTTITLGASGDTINLASGASQSGFGRTGTVDWQTGSIKTATFTAANGEGYFANTSGGAFTMNLPAGSAGAIVSVVDYTNTFQTNALTIAANGSEKIGGSTLDVNLNTQGQSVTLVYVDGTEGWVTTADSTENVIGETFISACGGNATLTCGNFKTHIFTGPGTFTVNSLSSCVSNNAVDYLVVGGGAGTYRDLSGGAGAGGMRFFSTAPGSNHPINNSGASPNTTITASVQTYPIAVGSGGSGGPSGGGGGATSGSVSTFSTVTSAGGGVGGSSGNAPGDAAGSPGASGGGGDYNTSTIPGGTGNTPPTSPAQGNNGGPGQNSPYWPGGGGGAGCAGAIGSGGDGAYIADSFIGPTAPSYGTPGPVASTRYFAGGGGGALTPSPGSGGTGGAGGGGQGSPLSSYGAGVAGTTNTGGGGSGSGGGGAGGAGGSGIVMIRYKFQ